MTAERKRKESDMDLGANIRQARKAAGITQVQLANRMGVYQKDVSRWESGEYVPGTLVFADICKALGASADEILELDTFCRNDTQNGGNYGSSKRFHG